MKLTAPRHFHISVLDITIWQDLDNKAVSKSASRLKIKLMSLSSLKALIIDVIERNATVGTAHHVF